MSLAEQLLGEAAPSNSLMGALAQISPQSIKTMRLSTRQLTQLWELGEASDGAPTDFLTKGVQTVEEISSRDGGDHETVGLLFYLIHLPPNMAVLVAEGLWVVMDEEMVGGIVFPDTVLRQVLATRQPKKTIGPGDAPIPD